MNLYKISLFLILLTFVACKTEFESNFCPALKDCTPASSAFSFSQIFSDDFNRANESPILSPWSKVQGSAGDDFELLSNAVAPKRGAGDSPTLVYDTAVTDMAVRLTVDALITGANFPSPTAGEIIVWARGQNSSDVNNGYFCGIDPTSGAVTIGKTVAGGASFLVNSTSTFTLDNSDSFQIVFTLINSSITCQVTENSTTTISASVTDSDFSTGFVGLKGGKNSADELEFDNFVLESGTP